MTAHDDGKNHGQTVFGRPDWVRLKNRQQLSIEERLDQAEDILTELLQIAKDIQKDVDSFQLNMMKDDKNPWPLHARLKNKD